VLLGAFGPVSFPFDLCQHRLEKAGFLSGHP
jgi:hypothetical protein